MGYEINPNAKIQTIRISFDASGKKGTDNVNKGISEHLLTLGFRKDSYGNYMCQGVTAHLNGASLELIYPVTAITPAIAPAP